MRNTTARTIIGIAIILLGIGTLLDGLEIFNFGDLVEQYWPTLLVIVGLVMLINSARNYIWAVVIIAVGVALQLRELDVLPDFNLWSLFWPTILIIIGVSVLTNRAGRATKHLSQEERDDVVALLGGAENKNKSGDYKGGKATAIMGGVKIDLRKAAIHKEATLEVVAIMGGVEIIVPETWVVRPALTPILGGVEDKTYSAGAKNAPVLHVVGDVIMAGVEIKN
ncbi:hypothetical protein JNJ66_04780 [Candidatus Saccharibacteria bacterium]|nr:hypothetical protein [Candidatus Saccharibacteria bacterium]